MLGARRMAANRILRELVLARIAQPQSKRATVYGLERSGGVLLNLDRVYQAGQGGGSGASADVNRTYRSVGLKWDEAPFPLPSKSRPGGN